jgi:uncharacterized membrane protein YczE
MNNDMNYFKKYMSREYCLKTIFCIMGVSIIGTGVGIMRYADLGIDPYSCFINGIYITFSHSLKFSFGTSFLLFTSCLLIAAFFVDRSKIGLGTVFSMTIVGYISDFGLFLCNLIPIEITSYLFIRFCVMFLGIIFIAIGSGIYFNTHIGVSPYDGLGLSITEKIGNDKIYRFLRIGTDFIFVLSGFLLGSKPGIGTIIMALFTGPLFSFFKHKFIVLNHYFNAGIP